MSEGAPRATPPPPSLRTPLSPRPPLSTPSLPLPPPAGPQDLSLDIYSFGVLMAELVSQAPLFLGLTTEQIFDGVVRAGARPDIPPYVPQEYRWGGHGGGTGPGGRDGRQLIQCKLFY